MTTTKDRRTYIRVHDGMPEHPKVEALSDAAFRLLVTLWCHCGRRLSDGFATKQWWNKQRLRARRELIAAGLVEVRDDGVHAHDYLKHQYSREEISALRLKRQKAGKLGGTARSSQANGQASATAHAQANGQAGATPTAQADAKQKGKQTPKQAAQQPLEQTPSYVDVDVNEELKNLAPAARKRDELFDAMVAVCGIRATQLTTTGRGSINRALAELRAVDATPAELATRARRYQASYPNTTLTPMALAKHWSQLVPKPQSYSPWNS